MLVTVNQWPSAFAHDYLLQMPINCADRQFVTPQAWKRIPIHLLSFQLEPKCCSRVCIRAREIAGTQGGGCQRSGEPQPGVPGLHSGTHQWTALHPVPLEALGRRPHRVPAGPSPALRAHFRRVVALQQLQPFQSHHHWPCRSDCRDPAPHAHLGPPQSRHLPLSPGPQRVRREKIPGPVCRGSVQLMVYVPGCKSGPMNIFVSDV